jgi:DNA-binding winged helix-turn-helix (wHTH) protein
VRLEWRVARLLLVLVENCYRTVPKSELFAWLWPDSSVGDRSLTRLVSVARRPLAADVIGNVYGEGDRIGVPVERSLPDAQERDASGEAGAPWVPTRSDRIDAAPASGARSRRIREGRMMSMSVVTVGGKLRWVGTGQR